MKIIAKVPADTIAYSCGERLMACEVTDDWKRLIRATEFFKTHEAARAFTDEHPEYKWKGRN